MIANFFKKLVRGIVKLVIFFILFGVMVAFLGKSCERAPARPETPEQAAARAKANEEWDLALDLYVRSEGHVKRFLKDPSSADFSPMHETKILDLDGAYAVQGWVLAANSFGGRVKQKYAVGYDDKRRLIALSVGSQTKTWTYKD